MASAAPARKEPARAGGEVITKLASWFLSALDRLGWTAVPRRALRNARRKLTPTQYAIYELILDQTIGNHEKGRPEWAMLRPLDMAEFAWVSERECQKAIQFLAGLDKEGNPVEGAHRVIELRGTQKRREYRVVDFSLDALPDRPLRSQATEDNGEEEPPAAEDLDDPTAPRERQLSQPFTAGGGRRGKLKLKDPWTFDRFDHDHQGEGRVEGRLVYHNNHLTLVTRLSAAAPPVTENAAPAPDSRTPVRKSNPAKHPAKHPDSPDFGTGVPKSDPAALGKFLDPIFARYKLKPASSDPELLRLIAGTLAPATLNDFSAIIAARFQVRPAKILPGLFVSLARDASRSAKERARLAREAPPSAPPPPKIHFDPEAEGSGSPWDLIRSHMRDTIAPQEYNNWFVQTAFAALPATGRVAGELVVRVPDEVSAKFLAQEFAPRLLAIAGELDLPVKRLRFMPPELPESDS